MPLAVLALRFLSELALLAALAVVGARLGHGAPGIGLAIACPLVAAVVWGQWVAPKSRQRLRDPARAGVEALLFAAAVVGLTVTGLVGAAAILGVAALIGAAGARVVGEPSAASDR